MPREESTDSSDTGIGSGLTGPSAVPVAMLVYQPNNCSSKANWW